MSKVKHIVMIKLIFKVFLKVLVPFSTVENQM